MRPRIPPLERKPARPPELARGAWFGDPRSYWAAVGLLAERRVADERAERLCGLLGLLTARQDAAQRPADLSLRCQRHSGADETGTWHDADVVLGFNRLSIIDLDHSHRPLRWGPPDAPERYTIPVQRGDLQLRA